MNGADLRPASIGQLLDRAVTLGVKFFIPLALVYAVFQIPVSLISVYASANTWRSLAQVLEAMNRHASPAEISQIMSHVSQGSNAAAVLFFIAVFFATPLSRAALVIAIGSAYLERSALPFAEAYRRGYRVWLPLIGVTLVWVAMGLLAYIGLILAFVGIGLLVALAYAVFHVLGILLGIIAGIAFIVVLLVAIAIALPAVAFSYFAVILENAGFITSVSSGISRTVGRSFWRALWTGLAGLAFLTGFSFMQTLIVSGVSALFYVVFPSMRHDAIWAIFAGSVLAIPIGIAGAIVITAFFEMAYFDMRVRREGFDLERAAAADAVALPEPG